MTSLPADTDAARPGSGDGPAGAGPATDHDTTGGPRRTGARLPHVPAFDGLRGAAVAAVLLFHAGHLTGGWLGVDLFFVLSGYLITALLITGWRSDGRVRLGAFWARRARRLGPALVLTLVGVAIYAAWLATPGEQWYVRRDGFATLFEVANWRAIALRNDYFAPDQLRSPLWHTWSLSIEEQMYLVWPPVVALVLRWRRSATAVLAAAAGGAALSVALFVGLHAHGTPDPFLYYATHTRALAVMLGAVLAAGRVALGPEAWARSRPARHAAGLVGAAGLATAWTFLDGSSELVFQGLLPLASLGGVLVVASVADRRHPGPVGQVMAVAPLRALGRISYGVYLFHWPLYLVLDGERTGLSDWPLTAVRIGATIVLATVSYVYVEQPIRAGGWFHGRPARAAVPAGIALASLALFAGTLEAKAPVTEPTGVAYASNPAAPMVMLVGDSVPLVMGVQMAEDRNALGISVANGGRPGCHLLASSGPIRGVEGAVRTDVSDCSADHFYRQQAAAVDPEVAVVLFGEFPNEAVRIDDQWLRPCQPEYLDLLRTRLEGVVDDLRSTGTPVVLLTAPGSQLSWVVDRVEGGEAGMQARVDCTNALLTDIVRSRSGVSLVDLAGFVCPPESRCKEQVDGVNLREDGLHFQGEGASYIARWLVPRVLAAAQDS